MHIQRKISFIFKGCHSYSRKTIHIQGYSFIFKGRYSYSRKTIHIQENNSYSRFLFIFKVFIHIQEKQFIFKGIHIQGLLFMFKENNSYSRFSFIFKKNNSYSRFLFIFKVCYSCSRKTIHILVFIHIHGKVPGFHYKIIQGKVPRSSSETIQRKVPGLYMKRFPSSPFFLVQTQCHFPDSVSYSRLRFTKSKTIPFLQNE